MLERELEAKVVALCREHGVYCRKWSSPSRRGVADRILVGGGYTLFLELKKPGEEPTKLQLREIALIKAAGGSAGWSDNLEQIKTIITTLLT